MGELGVVTILHQLVVDLTFAQVTPASFVIPVVLKGVQSLFRQYLHFEEAGAVMVSGADEEVASFVVDFYVICILHEL